MTAPSFFIQFVKYFWKKILEQQKPYQDSSTIFIWSNLTTQACPILDSRIIARSRLALASVSYLLPDDLANNLEKKMVSQVIQLSSQKYAMF